MGKRLLLLIIVLLLLFGGSLGLDRVAGLFLSPPAQGLIFPIKTTVKFNTPEFSSTVTTNSMGFRDREFTSQKSAQTRIVAIGDSFTFGWGVQAEDSWPKSLESRLRLAGLDVEVANLGKPGGSPTNYADVAEKSFTLLHPDLLIVAVLQGDDLAQMAFPPVGDSKLGPAADSFEPRASHPQLRKITKRLYPNLLRIVDGNSTELVDEWQSMARASYAGMTPAARARVDHLDDRVRKAFSAGELNPSLVYLAVQHPDYFMETMDLDASITKSHITQMADQLRRIKSAADQNHAKVIVVSVPYGIYVSKRSFETRRQIGFNATPQMLTSAEPDEAIRRASELAGIDFYEVTNEFRKDGDGHQLYFELDGHFNAAGHSLFAEALAPIIRRCLGHGTLVGKSPAGN
jgi:lysophospholipase L1-like esterase